MKVICVCGDKNFPVVCEKAESCPFYGKSVAIAWPLPDHICTGNELKSVALLDDGK